MHRDRRLRGGDAAPFDHYGTIVAALLTYGGLAYCYINFVNVGIASLRVRILTETAVKPEGLSRAALVTEYGVGEVVGARFTRLEQAGQVTARSGRFYRGAPIYFLAVGLSSLKRPTLGVLVGPEFRLNVATVDVQLSPREPVD